jgi:hypothetical protein
VAHRALFDSDSFDILVDGGATAGISNCLYRPPNRTNPGSTVGTIEAFDANVGSGRRLDEICKVVGFTSCSSPISQDVKGI